MLRTKAVRPASTFTAKNGEVQYNGRWLPTPTAKALLANLEGQLWAKSLHRQLTIAIARAEHEPPEEARPSIPSRAVEQKEHA